MNTWIKTEEIKGNFGKFGHITLNRSEALNALNLEMIIALEEVLTRWEKNPSICAIIFQSSSEKAFCAGGDIRALYEAGLKNDPHVFEFFQKEYQLDNYIAHYTKPCISFLNGITMGGGVGISLHGHHRVAGENFKFAMPETAIGFFPDVGGGHLLNQCPGAFGIYLGLTGARVPQKEAYALNLVDYCIDITHQSSIIEKLHELDLRDIAAAQGKVSQLLHTAHQMPDIESVLEPWHWVNEIFSENSVESIIEKLEQSASDNALIAKTLNDLQTKSPLSLKVTFEQLKRTEFLSLDECLKLDYILVHHFFKDKDFYEGVRALIVDKDNNPQWQPSKLKDVSSEQVNGYFEPIGDTINFQKKANLKNIKD